MLSNDGTVSDALSKAVFVLGPTEGLALLAAFPGTSALVAYREPNGRLALSMSPAFARVFKRVPPG